MDFQGSQMLGSILADLAPIRCIDIGARGGPTVDLEPLGRAAHVYGFEPDADECARLNALYGQDSGGFGVVRFLPVALSERHGLRTLHLSRHRGCSSLLEPILRVGTEFSREDFVAVDRKVDQETIRLDDAIEQFELGDVAYVKIDVEGLELEILRSAPTALDSSVLLIRSEVAFLTIRRGQPTYADIDHFLRGHHFIPMGFQELHEWRRLTRKDDQGWAEHPIPYSRGQIAHGDMLFIRDPETMDETNEHEIKERLRAAMLALLYDYVDHAHHLLSSPRTAEYVRDRYESAPADVLSEASRYLGARRSRLERRTWLRDLRRVLRRPRR